MCSTSCHQRFCCPTSGREGGFIDGVRTWRGTDYNQRWQRPLWSGQKLKADVWTLKMHFKWPAVSVFTLGLQCLQFISSGRHTETRTSQCGERWPHLSFMALTVDEGKEARQGKGEETERMDASQFMTAQSRTNTATRHVVASFSWTVLLTHQWKTLNSCLFNYANVYIYKWPCLVISWLN